MNGMCAPAPMTAGMPSGMPPKAAAAGTTPGATGRGAAGCPLGPTSKLERRLRRWWDERDRERVGERDLPRSSDSATRGPPRHAERGRSSSLKYAAHHNLRERRERREREPDRERDRRRDRRSLSRSRSRSRRDFDLERDRRDRECFDRRDLDRDRECRVRERDGAASSASADRPLPPACPADPFCVSTASAAAAGAGSGFSVGSSTTPPFVIHAGSVAAGARCARATRMATSQDSAAACAHTAAGAREPRPRPAPSMVNNQ